MIMDQNGLFENTVLFSIATLHYRNALFAYYK